MITDAYKISMALAGFPKRTETFYFSFRKGGAHYIPFDAKERVSNMLEYVTGAHQDAGELDKLLPAQYQHSPLMRNIRDSWWSKVAVSGVPEGAWVYEREPIFSVTGPSFLVSLLEPLVLQLSYEIQVATALKRHKGPEPLVVTATTLEGADNLTGLASDLGLPIQVRQCFDEYRDEVKKAAQALSRVVDLSRTFEVGLRAATCPEEHEVALGVLAQENVAGTSNVDAVFKGWNLVGTMGHEHVQRAGDDLSAFRTMRDCYSGTPSYLLDTHDTIRKGIPAALQAVREVNDGEPYSIRYDSGNILAQFVLAESMFEEAEVRPPVHIIEDGLTPEKVKRFEDQRRLLDIPEERVLYGLGGYFVSHLNPYNRNRVSAVYKLSQTGGRPTMKFGNEKGLGKQSVPGKPVVWRRIRGKGNLSIIAQESEVVPEHFYCLTNNPEEHNFHRRINSGLIHPRNTDRIAYVLSPGTQKLVDQAKKAHI